MASAIQMIDDNTFELNARGCKMTLIRSGDGWEMHTVNAMVRAYNRGYPVPKYFATLADVEAKYKTWAGVTTLIV